MKKILFICPSGEPARLLAKETNKAAEGKSLDIDIVILEENDAKNHLNDCSAILIGPQVSFLLNSIKNLVKGKDINVDVINPMAYGSANGKTVVKQIMALLG